jgi:hypothetical protein
MYHQFPETLAFFILSTFQTKFIKLHEEGCLIEILWPIQVGYSFPNVLTLACQ